MHGPVFVRGSESSCAFMRAVVEKKSESTLNRVFLKIFLRDTQLWFIKFSTIT